VIGADGADSLGEHATVLQILVLQPPPDLGEPGSERLSGRQVGVARLVSAASA
jgi:hypothetical protein